MSETTTKERPILFRPELVKAILEGRKTQTRRVIKSTGTFSPVREPWKHWQENTWGSCATDGTTAIIHCHYGQPGDRLWVRETWRPTWVIIPGMAGGPGVEYKADSREIEFVEAGRLWPCTIPGPWRPSIHLPRWACRLELEVVKVRVERLQEITEEDAKAEGTSEFNQDAPLLVGAFRDAFRNRWNRINEARGYGWNANPFVWVIEFRKVEEAAKPDDCPKCGGGPNCYHVRGEKGVE